MDCDQTRFWWPDFSFTFHIQVWLQSDLSNQEIQLKWKHTNLPSEEM